MHSSVLSKFERINLVRRKMSNENVIKSNKSRVVAN